MTTMDFVMGIVRMVLYTILTVELLITFASSLNTIALLATVVTGIMAWYNFESVEQLCMDEEEA